MTQTLLVNKSDFADVTLVDQDEGPLADGAIRVSVGPWALTANNVTYMVTGDQIGYWGFFRPDAYGIEIPSSDIKTHGRMPVWGYGKVTESKCEGIVADQEFYGFLPVAQSFDMTPVKVSKGGFMDGAAHRQELHSLYNRYVFTSADPSFEVHKDLQPLLRPLFTTSFLIDDFLDDEGFFGAKQVLVLSASSKTALGTAYCLKERGGVKVTGLTSDSNKAFTEKTGFYDEVQTYDTITDLSPDVKTVIVDMSGNADVIATVQDHYEENLTYICRVGLSHWDAKPSEKSQHAAPQAFFFAPDRAARRMTDWGGASFMQKLAARWIPFLNSASTWLEAEKAEGVGSILKVYKDVLEGSASPDKGYLFTL